MNQDTFNCPLPHHDDERISIAHGGGGLMMHRLLEKTIFPRISPEQAHTSLDSALIADGLAFSTDSFVVSPLFFPGGDIGRLSVFGTTNDLAMVGAEANFLSLGLILEEGFPMSDLERILASIDVAQKEVGAKVVTGDTKVVPRGKGDGVYINTAGVGCLMNPTLRLAPGQVCDGDHIIVSGDLGRHEASIIVARKEFGIEADITSDLAPLTPTVRKLIAAGLDLHCLRDLTRGGLGSALHEICHSTRKNLSFVLDSEKLPLSDEVSSLAELLGFDPLFMANEGRFVAFLSPADSEQALAIMQSMPGGSAAAIIGTVRQEEHSQVWIKSAYGSEKKLPLLNGDQLPRIC